MTPTPQPLTAEELDDIERWATPEVAAEWSNHIVRRLLATISSLEAKIAGLRGAFVARGPSGQVRDKTEDWERRQAVKAVSPPYTLADVEELVAALKRGTNVWSDRGDVRASRYHDMADQILAAGYRKSPAPSGEATWTVAQYLVERFTNPASDAPTDYQGMVDYVANILTSDRAATEARVRKECAKVADEYFAGWSPMTWTNEQIVAFAKKVAAAIRAGDKT